MKYLPLICFILASITCEATTLTGTISDADGTLWPNTIYILQFVPSSGAVFVSGGNTFPFTIKGISDSSGNINATVPGLDTISPAGGSWSISLCPPISSECQTIEGAPITGTAVDLSSFISLHLKGPRIPASYNTKAFTDAEIIGISGGESYWNVVSNTCRQYNGSIWNPCIGTGASTSANNTFTGSNSFTLQNNIYSPLGGPSTCSYQIHFGGTLNTYNGTTQGECAWLASVKAADSNNLMYEFTPPPGYTMTVDSNCLIEPDNGFVNIQGHGSHNYKGSYIKNVGCVGPLIQFSPNNFPWGWYIKNVALDGNNLSPQAINSQANLQGVVEDVELENFDGGSDGVVKSSNSYELSFNRVKIQGSYLNNLTVATVTCTSDGSGNLAGACTVSSGGSNYTSNAHMVAFLQGAPAATSSNPCTTMPTFTITGTTTVTGVTASGGSGCGISTTYSVLVFDMPTNPYAMNLSSTDYVAKDIRIGGVGRIAAVNVTGGDATFENLHAYYVPEMTLNSSNLVLTNPRYDSIFLHGSEFNSGAGTIVDSPFFVWSSALGLTYPFVNPFLFDSASHNVRIDKPLCAGQINPTGYYHFLTSAGVQNGPPSDTVINGNMSCDVAQVPNRDYLNNSISSFLILEPQMPATAASNNQDSPRLYLKSYHFDSATNYTHQWYLQVNRFNSAGFVCVARTGGDPNSTCSFSFDDGTANTNLSVQIPTLMTKGVQTVSGCTLSANTGGGFAGQFTAGALSCTVTITPGTTAAHGWSCWANDMTTPANLFKQSATSTTTATITGTAVLNDVINYGCIGY